VGSAGAGDEVVAARPGDPRPGERVVGFNWARLQGGEALGLPRRFASCVDVEDVDAVYRRVIDAGGSVEAELVD